MPTGTNNKKKNMKRTIYFLAICFVMLTSLSMMAQPSYSTSLQQEALDRGLVAVKTGEFTYVTWRHFTSDMGKTYRLFRNGEKLVDTEKTSHRIDHADGNYDVYQLQLLDGEGNVLETTQQVRPFLNRLEITLTPPVSSADNNTRGTYSPNDISVGDVDGDGQYELFVKWNPDGTSDGSFSARDNETKGLTSSTLIDCYRLDGTRLWQIDLGVNIRSGAHYTQFMVYDFDGDGKVEMICKTAAHTRDGMGNFVSEAATDEAIKAIDNSANYRISSSTVSDQVGQIMSGPELLTVFDGETGKAVHTIWYKPNRAGTVDDGIAEYAGKDFWGDNYSNRSERYLACVAYLDGEKPSAVFVRGYYRQAYFWAVDYKNQQLVHRWLHASVSDNEVQHYDASWTMTSKTYTTNMRGDNVHCTAYANGNHNLSVGDYDGDGKDEITFGSAAIDDDGQLMYAVGFGHGDALHVGDMDPDRPGLEVMHVHEESPYGWDVHDAKTGEVIWSAEGTKDNGRGLAADLMDSNPGYEFYSATDHNTRSVKTGESLFSEAGSMNFRMYWDGTLQDNLGNGNYNSTSKEYSGYAITRWGGSAYESVATLEGSACNGTKATPCLSADILGDWREEVILRNEHTLYIYTTTMPTDYKVPCLMTDHIYRMGVVWQNTGYNQPPHLGYYLPEAETTQDMSASSETIYYVASDLVNYEPTEVGTGSIVWEMNSGTITEQAKYGDNIAEGFGISNITIGSNLSVSGAETAGTYTETLFTQTTTKAVAASDANAIDFVAQLNDDYVFVPTAVELIASRFASSYPRIAVSWLDGAGTANSLASEVQPSASPNYSELSYAIADASDCSGSVGIRVNYFTKGGVSAKSIGLSNVKLTGKLIKVTPPEPTAIVVLNNSLPFREGLWVGYIYTLDGRRVNANYQLPKGIYISNGKKIVVR